MVVSLGACGSNPIGHECTLLARAPGRTLSDVYAGLSEAERDGILDQLIDILSHLHAHRWDHIGGLNLDDTKHGPSAAAAAAAAAAATPAKPAGVVDETFWQAGDLHLWPAMVAGYVRHYVRLIGLHDSLALLRGDVPRLEAFAAQITQQPEPATQLGGGSAFVFAHKDLHFANQLHAAGRITAMLDWEFAGVVPAPLWNTRRAFLWNARPGEENLAAKRRLVARFEDRVRARNDPVVTERLLTGVRFASPEQDAMQAVVDYLRAITEVVPRGGRDHVLPAWRDTMLASLATFGV
ncbi:Protein kinase-like domain protein [Niveomyces insectorum RCEF 264]|uniref:Protein kinase-like domain protein n=1 Tax=Niveomyces insectorum RCEF 264 TaxID=1081102 RepID=A0A162I843_9HYPO|nr:Protein kinase-like domain protein [Niveomyces insectorum RCEF 264]